MKGKIRSLIYHPVFSNSAVMIVGTNLANVLAYIYHMVFGRLLGPSLYGELVSLISIIGMGSALFSFLGLVVVKFISSSSNKELAGVYYVLKRIMLGILVILLVSVLFTVPISNFLYTKPSIVILLAPILFFSFLHLVYSSFLQGLFRFKELVAVNISGWVLKIILGLLLVYLGLSLFGTIVAMLLSALITLMAARYVLGEIKSSETEGKKVFKKMFKYCLPALVVTLFINSYISTDVILVKHFFSSLDSGIYACLSTLGKIIFYGAAPVSAVMFPLVSKRFSYNQSTKVFFLYSLLLTLLISVCVLLVYWLFPGLVVTLLFGKEYLSATPYLLWFGVFSTIFVLNFLTVNYYLSMNQTFPSYLVLMGALAQALGIYLFHDSLMTVISVSVFSSGLLLIALLAFSVFRLKNAGHHTIKDLGLK